MWHFFHLILTEKILQEPQQPSPASTFASICSRSIKEQVGTAPLKVREQEFSEPCWENCTSPASAQLSKQSFSSQSKKWALKFKHAILYQKENNLGEQSISTFAFQNVKENAYSGYWDLGGKF